MKHFRAASRLAWFAPGIEATGSGTGVPARTVKGKPDMTAHRSPDLREMTSTASGRPVARLLWAAVAALALGAATPAFANQGDAQEMLADGGDYVVTDRQTADGGDYVVTDRQTADGGDYVVTNRQTADGGDYVVTDRQTADGGDYVVTNRQTADGGDYVVTNRQTADGGDYVVSNERQG
jgi:hypothetical protein